MVNTVQITERLKSYILSQLTTLSDNSPMIGLMKPLITRALDKNFSKVTKALDLIADENGNIDIENILTEMTNNIMNAKPFTFKTSFIGDIEIGEGTIKLNIPLTDKKLIFNTSDLENIKNVLTSN